MEVVFESMKEGSLVNRYYYRVNETTVVVCVSKRDPREIRRTMAHGLTRYDHRKRILESILGAAKVAHKTHMHQENQKALAEGHALRRHVATADSTVGFGPRMQPENESSEIKEDTSLYKQVALPGF